MLNEDQSKNIMKITSLDKTDLDIKDHKTLNQIKGTIMYKNKPHFTQVQIATELKEQHVSSIYQMQRIVDDVKVD